VWINGAWIKTGFVPPEQMVKPLVGFLNGAAGGELWHTNQIQKFLPEAEPLVAPPSGEKAEMPAGVLAVPISHTPRDYLLFFRSEESRYVDWGGEPEKTVGPLGDRLTPRKSFDLWREEVRGQSTPWTDGDVAIADAAQNYLRDVVLRHTEATAEERKRTEVRRKLVNEELNHRVKNILALVKSITEQSRAAAVTVDDYAAAVIGRIQALAFAHDQISRDGGGGDLRRLVESEVAAFGGVGASGRTVLDGPPVRLNARAYSSLALVAHELSTNAAKYGALAAENGMVRAAWKLLPNGDCEFTWVERGGKPVEKPTRAGFGSTLITRVVPFDLGGEAEIDYPPEGVIARFIVPARHLVAVQPVVDVGGPKLDGSAKAHGRPDGAASLAGKRVLLVEDQVLIALDAESCLKSMGAAQVVIAPTSEHAIKQIGAARPDLAVLDVNLGDHTSAPVAEMLRSQGIPFVFATGYGDSVMIPDSLKTVPVVRKPYGDATLAAAIAGVLKNSGEK
jgi:light-regulated signal transduction histidine kinase (bacteriophytochrome)